jgi:hypothetical protein
LFALSSSPAVEQVPLHQGAESQASLEHNDPGSIPATNSAFGFSRLLRAKFLVRTALSHHWAIPDTGLDGATQETPITRSSAKYDVYQQMNVYRL